MCDSLPGLTPHCPTRLLLILGPPASGKTRLAEQLAARYPALTLSKDEIKEILFDTLGSLGPVGVAEPVGSAPPSVTTAGPRAAAGAWSRALSDASFALLFALAHRLRPSGRTLLLEGNFRPDEHEPAIAALLAGHGAPVADEGATPDGTPRGSAPHSGPRAPPPQMSLAQVLCHARPVTLIARLEARASDPTRHRGHRDHDTAAQLRHTAPVARFLALPGLQLRFDSEAPTEAELSRLYSVLDPWMSLAAR